MTKPDPQPEVSINWRRIGREPSPAWHRLWHKLLAKGKERPRSTPPDASEEECKDGNEREVPDF